MSYKHQYNKLRAVVHKEHRPGLNMLKWRNLCRDLTVNANNAAIREMAKTFGVPPAYWNNPGQVCAMITPRAADFFQKIHCDNADEPTMDGDEVGSIPEFLKYTFTASNGQVYCSNVLDLYNAMNSGQKEEPYRRFAFTPEVKQDIKERYEFLKKVIEPHGLGQGIMAKIRDTILALTPGQQLKARLVEVWGKLHYPKYAIEEVMAADEQILNGIFAALVRQEGLTVNSQEKNAFNAARGNADAKRKILIDTMARLAGVGANVGTYGGVGVDLNNLVALELAINDSTPQANVRPREDDDDDLLAAEGSLRGAPAARLVAAPEDPIISSRAMLMFVRRIPIYIQGAFYYEGDVVQRHGQIYKVLRDGYARGEPDSMSYQFQLQPVTVDDLLTLRVEDIPVYIDRMPLKKLDMVSHNNAFYQAIRDLPQSPPPMHSRFRDPDDYWVIEDEMEALSRFQKQVASGSQSAPLRASLEAARVTNLPIARAEMVHDYISFDEGDIIEYQGRFFKALRDANTMRIRQPILIDGSINPDYIEVNFVEDVDDDED